MKSLLAVALLSAGVLGTAHAAPCAVSLEGNDAMKFNLSRIDVPKSCASFTIHLKHTGQLARNVMGHNVVIAKPADVAAIDADGIRAGLTADYIKAGDTRVIAHSKVIGGGQSTSVSFPVAKLGTGANTFFCSFPGHSGLMRGTVQVK